MYKVSFFIFYFWLAQDFPPENDISGAAASPAHRNWRFRRRGHPTLWLFMIFQAQGGPGPSLLFLLLILVLIFIIMSIICPIHFCMHVIFSLFFFPPITFSSIAKLLCNYGCCSHSLTSISK